MTNTTANLVSGAVALTAIVGLGILAATEENASLAIEGSVTIAGVLLPVLIQVYRLRDESRRREEESRRETAKLRVEIERLDVEKLSILVSYQHALWQERLRIYSRVMENFEAMVNGYGDLMLLARDGAPESEREKAADIVFRKITVIQNQIRFIATEPVALAVKDYWWEIANAIQYLHKVDKNHFDPRRYRSLLDDRNRLFINAIREELRLEELDESFFVAMEEKKD